MQYRLLLSAFLGCFYLVSGVAAQTSGWGYNPSGQLGNGNQTDQPTPTSIVAVSDAVGIGGGYLHTVFLKPNGTLVAAGLNSRGQVGNGTTTSPIVSPVPVLSLTNVIQASGGGAHSSALLADGTVWNWGNNEFGQIGNGTTTTSGCLCIATATQVSITDVIQIEAGYNHTLALKSDGTVWAWGLNDNGQLGDNSPTNRPSPVQVGASVPGFSNIIAVSAGDLHSIALKADGTVWVWGDNSSAQIGNGSTGPDQLNPVQNTTLTNVVQVTAGAYHNLALLKDGTVRVWGNNLEGEVGNGVTGATQPLPLQTLGIANVVEIEATGYTNYVRLQDGSVRAWGYNFYGSVGNGSTNTSGCFCQPTPVTTSVGANNPAISSGHFHAFRLNPAIAVSAGTNQSVQGDNLHFIFDNVTGAGSLSYSGIDPAAVSGSYTVPPGYLIQNQHPAYDITTTTSATGNIYVCIDNVNEYDPTQFGSLKILHGEGSSWVDRTVSSDFRRRQICARVTSLSPFVIAQGLAPTAGEVSISGRVLRGATGISRATVSVTDARGTVHMGRTNGFGYYRVEGLSVGPTYIITVSAKGFEFEPRTVSLKDDLVDIDFKPIE